MQLCKRCHGDCQCVSPVTPKGTCLICGNVVRTTDCTGYLPPETGQEAVAPWMSAMANSDILATHGRVELRVWGHYVNAIFAKAEVKRLSGLAQGTMKVHPVMKLSATRTDTELDDTGAWKTWFSQRAPGVAPGHLMLVRNFNEYLVLVITPTAASAENALRKMEAARTFAERAKAEQEAKAQDNFKQQTQALWTGLHLPALGDGNKQE